MTERADAILRLDRMRGSNRPTLHGATSQLLVLANTPGGVSIGALEAIPGVRVKAIEGHVKVTQLPVHYTKPDRYKVMVPASRVEGVDTCSHCNGTGWLSVHNKPPCKDCKMTGFKDGVLHKDNSTPKQE